MLLTNPAATLRRRGHLPMAKHTVATSTASASGERGEVAILRSLLAKTDCPCCYHRGCQRSQGRLVDIFTASGRAHCAIFNLRT
ncbi:hypothetical protein TIFTF001_025183 [Ficus carica]|uniref:Uncharacterized protein n=1 Tax=Ficus carica TaxID=3494 RepID=A0AA88DDY6_FICCA|nr:hypothetical protein TIFTF001_025183 [Ficus carica]